MEFVQKKSFFIVLIGEQNAKQYVTNFVFLCKKRKK